jgi:hypothetical protein
MELDKSGSNLFELLLVSHQRPKGGGRLFNLMEATPTSFVRKFTVVEWGHHLYENFFDGNRKVNLRSLRYLKDLRREHLYSPLKMRTQTSTS